MSERMQILFMQVRLVRLASEEWHISLEEANRIFRDWNVYGYIEELWGIFHIEGDHAVLEDIEKYLDHKGVKV